jgi:hypothetical protein
MPPFWFNKTCRLNHLTTNYFKITIKGHNRQYCNTKKAVTTYRINQELRFLYNKTQTLNIRPYHLHLQCAKQWPSIWPSRQHQHSFDFRSPEWSFPINFRLDFCKQFSSPLCALHVL